MDQYVGWFEVSMANLGELHVVECFEHLEGKDFSDGREERFLGLPVLLDHDAETGWDVVHDDTEKALLGKGRVPHQLFSKSIPS